MSDRPKMHRDRQFHAWMLSSAQEPQTAAFEPEGTDAVYRPDDQKPHILAGEPIDEVPKWTAMRDHEC